MSKRNKVKFEYDREADAAYLTVGRGKVVESEVIMDALGHLKQLGATITPPVERTA